MNSAQYLTIKCYHITKVYQRDVPAMTKGHMHGFYQCEHHQLINHHQNLALYTYLRILIESSMQNAMNMSSCVSSLMCTLLLSILLCTPCQLPNSHLHH